MLRRASSTSAAACTPTICSGWAGLMERILFSVETRRPPMSRGYSRPNCARTFSSAASIAARFSVAEKSVSGSLRNSESCMTTCPEPQKSGPRGASPAERLLPESPPFRPGGQRVLESDCFAAALKQLGGVIGQVLALFENLPAPIVDFAASIHQAVLPFRCFLPQQLPQLAARLGSEQQTHRRADRHSSQKPHHLFAAVFTRHVFSPIWIVNLCPRAQAPAAGWEPPVLTAAPAR